ncbi:unnamed protein product, partial [Vicia faba]
QFIWRLYLGLDHEPNPEDAAIWTAKTAIIWFNITELHHNDRVKMQEIRCDPTSLSPWHLKRVDTQWGVNNWKDFVPKWYKMWRMRNQYVLQFSVFLNQNSMRHTNQYIDWYISVANPEIHVSHPRYLIDPRTR